MGRPNSSNVGIVARVSPENPGPTKPMILASFTMVSASGVA